MDMASICASDPPCDGLHQSVIRSSVPRLKVIAVHPDDIGEILIAPSQVLSVCERPFNAVGSQHTQPTAGLDGIQKDNNAILGRNVNHSVRALEIVGVRCREITATGKGGDAIKSRGFFIAPIGVITEKIDPECVDAVTPSVDHICCGFPWRQIGDQGLRSVADYQKRHIILIDEVAVVGTRFERKCRKYQIL